MRSKEHIEWRYFSNIGKSSSRHFTSINKGARTKFYSIASATVDEDIDRIELEPSTVLINMARRAASAPVRMGNVTETINRLAKRLVFYDRFWQSRRQSFLRFLLSSLATFYKSAISSYKTDELAHDEDFEDEIGGDIGGGLYEGDEEFVETFEDEAIDHRARAILMTRQFAAFLVTTYIAFFANKYISAVQNKRLPQEQIDKAMQSYVNKLIQSLGLQLISRDVKRLIMPLRMLLQYYISDYNIAPIRFKRGQEVLSQIIELLVKVVVDAVDEGGFYSNRSRKNKYYSSEAILDSYRESILSDEFESYEDNLEDDLDESLEEETYKYQGDDDFVEDEDISLGGTYDDEEDLDVDSLYEEPFEYEESTYPDDSELDEYEEFAKLFLSIRPRYSSVLFSKNFVKSKKTNSVRMFSNKYFTEELARALYKEFRKLFSSEEEAKEAAEQATLVVEKAAVEGLVESLQEAAAKAAELVQEQAESEKGGSEDSEDEGENWWDSFIEETDEDEDKDKNKGEDEEGEGEDSGEEEKEESEKEEESKEDESDEEDVKESRLWLYSKRKKKNKILSKYNRRNVKQNHTRYETR
ncbi:MAG: hypothetical protein QW255_04445 [Candidatus Bilamarchaeaceae archaeon]